MNRNDQLKAAQHELHRKRQERAEWLRDQGVFEPTPARVLIPAPPERANGNLTAPPAQPLAGIDPAELVTLDTLDTSNAKVAKAVRAARTWMERKNAGDESISLILVAAGVPGDTERTGFGCGKTHIARAIQWSRYEAVDGVPIAPCGVFYMAKDLIHRVEDTQMHKLIRKGHKDWQDRITGKAYVVVIDDVGTEGQIPFIGNEERQEAERWVRYFRIVNYCYENKISLVLTANMKLDKLATHVGGRAWSRLQEMAPAGFMLDLTGVPDWRRKASNR